MFTQRRDRACLFCLSCHGGRSYQILIVKVLEFTFIKLTQPSSAFNVNHRHLPATQRDRFAAKTLVRITRLSDILALRRRLGPHNVSRVMSH